MEWNGGFSFFCFHDKGERSVLYYFYLSLLFAVSSWACILMIEGFFEYIHGWSVSFFASLRFLFPTAG